MESADPAVVLFCWEGDAVVDREGGRELRSGGIMTTIVQKKHVLNNTDMNSEYLNKTSYWCRKERRSHGLEAIDNWVKARST